MDANKPIDEGPNLAAGIALARVPAGTLLAGNVDGEAVLVSHLSDGIHVVAARCTHYGAHLGTGLVVNEEIRCPCHHAAFSLRTGEALRAPGIQALATWRVEVTDQTLFVREANTPVPKQAITQRKRPKRIVIVGGGAAGYAAAEQLKKRGFDGNLTILSSDSSAPYDRPNLSKGLLAGTASEEWIPLTAPDHYIKRGIALKLNRPVAAIDCCARRVVTAAGGSFPFDALLLATGSAPRRHAALDSSRGNVFTLRSLSDARHIVSACAGAGTAVIIGSGFIGLEAAAALTARGLDVRVVSHELLPMCSKLGKQVAQMLMQLHESKGVRFHLQTQVNSFDGRTVLLDDTTRLRADVVIVAVGVTPCTTLAEAAGIAVDDGILVDRHLQTSVAAIFAAGDIARYPFGGESIRVEHWVNALRQGATVADNMLGDQRVFDSVPFFWTEQHGVELRATGAIKGWDEVRVEGTIETQDLIARYYRKGNLVAAVTVGRDRVNLEIEHALETRSAQAPGLVEPALGGAIPPGGERLVQRPDPDAAKRNPGPAQQKQGNVANHS